MKEQTRVKRLGILKRARKYGYSNARVKGMESKLIGSSTMKSIAEAKSIDAILSILFQTDYNASIIKFGGLEISPTLLDFAISESMAEKLNKLAEITPKDEQRTIRKITARWALGNVKLVLEALERGQTYDSISKYIISADGFGTVMLQEVMKSESIEQALSMLMRNRHHKELLGKVLSRYIKTGSIMDALAAIDQEHYRELGELAVSLGRSGDKSAIILRMDIDMRNMITLLRAKRKGLKFEDISDTLIRNGDVGIGALSGMYSSSGNVAEFAAKSKAFDLNAAIELYRENDQMLPFEVSMRNQIFNRSIALLRSSVLSFGTLVDYIYLKEIEVFTIRALVKAREYGLSKEEVSRLVIWSL
ncbi:MAG: V-type ATPase subunit [Candidatus Micrarchaeota archaeon]|nr:V-type ATPase subunit [Candidatus Micrarchaeota archaeon]